jgi:hypothetical protein
MTQGRASLRTSIKDTSESGNPTLRSSGFIKAILLPRSSETVQRQPDASSSTATKSTNLKSPTSVDAAVAHLNSQGGLFGLRVAKAPDPIEMPKLNGRLSKVLGNKK